MTFTPSGIGQKLLIAFSMMAGLMIIAVVIGVAGFSLVAKTERNVINSAVPALVEARQLSDLSSRIIFNAQVLAKSKDEQERERQGKSLTIHIQALHSSLKSLERYSFKPALVKQLTKDVENIINNLAMLGILVGRKLELTDKVESMNEQMTSATMQIDSLSQSQVSNANTIAVANVSRIYDLVEKGNTSAVFKALDSLVEVDMDLSERLFELRFLSLQVINMLDDSIQINRIDELHNLKKRYTYAVTVIQQRVKSVEDPSRSAQLVELGEVLNQSGDFFHKLEALIHARQDVERMEQQNLVMFQQLNQTVDEIIQAANLGTQQAVTQVDQTLTVARNSLIAISALGMIALVLIMWRFVYARVIRRINDYSQALMSLARGDLEIRLISHGDDELAQMGRAIMVARDTAYERHRLAQVESKIRSELQQHKTSLERLVAERTSQLKEANSQLNQEVKKHAEARTEAERANRAKSAFLATMSHEIRTPMNGVLGTASLLADTGLNKQQAEYLAVINRSGETLLDILNDVLDYSKIEAGHLDIRPSNFSLRELVQDVYSLLNNRAATKGIALVTEIDEQLEEFWVGDATRIRQILVNLVGNAIKFTNEGQVSVWVSSSPLHPGRLDFQVEDTGIGIPYDEQDSMFDAFQQSSDGRQTMGGTGLGLAISRRIVEAMGGEIGLDSTPGEGSCFWFSLNLASGECEVAAEAVAQDDIPSACVLLVEDNPVNSLVAEGFLRRLGHRVIVAEDGAQAKVVFAEQRFDVALLDINLPDTDGVTLLGDLKQIERDSSTSHETPMVAFSAHVFNEEVELYLNAGFSGFLPKPLVEHQLVDTIAKVLAGRERVNLSCLACGDENVDLEQAIDNAEQKVVNSDMPILDEKVLGSDLQVLGAELVNKMIGLFSDSSADTMAKLLPAIEEVQLADVANLAHTLKGAAGTMGLTRLHQVCQAFEKSAKEGDIGDLSVEQLESVYRASIEALNQSFGGSDA
ncbi:histidine kinase [Photobacterium aquae]|uniref:Sensory/regulatory protein RpfC n=1 Tax=Photobacterium aquae TaxID=1195763 RepID=A0A0J1HB91_9GAMM|nr:TMAO reductase system sensor histidine kinase/response regulator TorS [Photobacterium aquae]KLV08923.1 histidine kinase [Photobacterium aquae]